MTRYDPVKDCLQSAQASPVIDDHDNPTSSSRKPLRQHCPDLDPREHTSLSCKHAPALESCRSVFGDRFATSSSLFPLSSVQASESLFHRPRHLPHPVSYPCSPVAVRSASFPHLGLGTDTTRHLKLPNVSSSDYHSYRNVDFRTDRPSSSGHSWTPDLNDGRTSRTSSTESIPHSFSFSYGESEASEENSCSESDSSVNHSIYVATGRLAKENLGTSPTSFPISSPAQFHTVPERQCHSDDSLVSGKYVNHHSLDQLRRPVTQGNPGPVAGSADHYTSNHIPNVVEPTSTATVASVGGSNRPRHGKQDPVDKYLVESVVDGIRVWCCTWDKTSDGRTTIPCAHKASRSNARQHVKSRHLKLRPYVCPECGRTWRDQGARYNHRVREHGYVPKKPKRWPEDTVGGRPSTSESQQWSVAFIMEPNCAHRQQEPTYSGIDTRVLT